MSDNMPRDSSNMDTSTGVQPYKEGTTTPMRGEVKPLFTVSGPRREIDEDTVADLVEALEREGDFLHPIVVREDDQRPAPSSRRLRQVHQADRHRYRVNVAEGCGGFKGAAG